MVSGGKNGGEDRAKKQRKLLKEIHSLESKLYDCVTRKSDLETKLQQVEMQIGNILKLQHERNKILEERKKKKQALNSFLPEPQLFIDLSSPLQHDNIQQPLPPNSYPISLVTLPMEIRLRILSLLSRRDLQSILVLVNNFDLIV